MWRGGRGGGAAAKASEETDADKDGRMDVRGPRGVLGGPGMSESYVAAIQTLTFNIVLYKLYKSFIEYLANLYMHVCSALKFSCKVMFVYCYVISLGPDKYKSKPQD